MEDGTRRWNMGKGRGLRAVVMAWMAWMAGDMASIDMCRRVQGAVRAGELKRLIGKCPCRLSCSFLVIPLLQRTDWRDRI